LCCRGSRASGDRVSIAVVALFGAVALGLLVVGIHLWLVLTAVQTPLFVAAVKRLMLADNRERAVKLCRAVGHQVADGQLVLFLIGLELPRQTLPEGTPSGYRGSLPAERFDDRLRQLVAQQAPFFYRKTNRRGVTAVVGGLAAAGLAVAAHGLGGLFGPPLAALGAVDAQEHALLYGAGAVLVLTFLAGRRWRRTMAGQTLVLQELLPFLRPLEDMLPSDQTAAAAAREVLGESAGGGARLGLEQQIAISTAGQAPAATAQLLEGRAGRSCPSCGRTNEPHYRFCLGCGSLLE